MPRYYHAPGAPPGVAFLRILLYSVATMARECVITGKKSRVGGGYSNRTRATKFNPTGSKRNQVNMQKKTIFVPELNKKVTVKVSAKGLKVIKKRGAYKTLKEAGLIS